MRLRKNWGTSARNHPGGTEEEDGLCAASTDLRREIQVRQVEGTPRGKANDSRSSEACPRSSSRTRDVHGLSGGSYDLCAQSWQKAHEEAEVRRKLKLRRNVATTTPPGGGASLGAGQTR